MTLIDYHMVNLTDSSRPKYWSGGLGADLHPSTPGCDQSDGYLQNRWGNQLPTCCTGPHFVVLYQAYGGPVLGGGQKRKGGDLLSVLPRKVP